MKIKQPSWWAAEAYGDWENFTKNNPEMAAVFDERENERGEPLNFVEGLIELIDQGQFESIDKLYIYLCGVKYALDMRLTREKNSII